MHTDPGTKAERFLALLRPLERDVEVYARRLIWEPQQVSDVIQNAVMRAYAAFDRYREEASFRAWLFRILTNEVFALNRKYARVARFEYQVEPGEMAELRAYADTEVSEVLPAQQTDLQSVLEPELLQALRTLTDTERAVLLLRAITELRYREISQALDVPMGTVMGTLSRARQKMRAALERPGKASSPAKPQT